jgi:hypothetical protein
MGTLGGFPNPPALWLRRAKPASAYAVMATRGSNPATLPPTLPPPRFARPPAMVRADEGEGRKPEGEAAGAA